MSKTYLTCPLCGTHFNPDEYPACVSCPFEKNCQMVCCPGCGYNVIDPGRSKLARLLTAIFSKEDEREKKTPAG